MNIEFLYQYCLSKNAATESFPFDESTLVFKVAGKMFALCSLSKWENGNQHLNLKCDPEKAKRLRNTYESITPGWHMNKKHWNTLDLGTNEISIPLLKELIDHSYNMVVKGLPKKVRDQL